MTQKDVVKVKQLAKEAEQAARVVARNRFLIETYMSLDEARAGKTRSHASVAALFRKLSI